MSHDETLLKRVKKLLQLANSDNEHEARLAAERAQELLTRHNLTVQDVRRTSADYEMRDASEALGRNMTEAKYVDNIVQRFFFVRVFRRGTSKSNGRWQRVTRYVGTPSNVEVALYIRDFLLKEFRVLWQAYKRRTGASAKSRQSYYCGLFDGICAQLEASQKRVEQETGLVVVQDRDLMRYMQEICPNLRKTTTNVNTGDRAAFGAGEAAGREMKIRKGLGERVANGNGQYLEA